MKRPIKNNINTEEPVYITWAGGQVPKEALDAMSEASEEYGSADAYYGGRDNYSNLTPNTSGRPGLTREDYGAFRPSERVPTKTKDIIRLADKIYNKVGLIRNIIDLMGDFACEGARVSHPDKKIEAFYRNWFNRVEGKDRSERFLNNLYRTANVVIRRQTAKITVQDKNNLFKTMAKVDFKKIEQEKVKKREIPWKYTFLNPATIEVVGEQLASLSSKKRYAINLPDHIRQLIKFPKSKEEKEIIKGLPREIKEAAKSNKLYYLPEDKTLVFHYKKDDWQDMAIPMVHPIMDDIFLLEKLKLADSAALDGAISNVRIFKLGSLEHKLAPSPFLARKLKEVLGNNVGGGTLDIVWGPDIELLESRTEVHKFLGGAKYEPTLNNIYGGIGIPPTLTGAFSAGGTTNNFISLKTLTQRLEYGRGKLADFWNHEFEIIQKAMGFSEPASIEFDYPDLGDSESEKRILLEMSDRNLISDELLQQRFKNNTRLEDSRIAREEEERKNGSRPRKAGPFFEAEPEIQLDRIKLQNELTEDKQEEGGSNLPTKPNKKGVSGEGRPNGENDKKKRKQKKFAPRTKASVYIWAADAQEKISEVLNPVILESLDKANMRSLTMAEQKTAERVKLGVLFNMEPFSYLGEDNIVSSFQAGNDLASDIMQTINNAINDVSLDLDRKMNLSELRSIYNDVYVETKI